MYSVVFENDNGQKYLFGANGNTVFDMDIGNGMSINLGTSQGFSQVGETVETRSVTGRTIAVSGVVYGDVPAQKRQMRNIIAPFASGRLVFEGRQFIRVVVKDAPSFSPVRDDGRFTMSFFAPFPFFYDLTEQSVLIGEILPMFRFPVNYGEPHKFGARSGAKYKNIFYDGDVNTAFSLTITASGVSVDPTITNLTTFERLKINGTLSAGDVVRIYRDSSNILRAELESGGETVDILSWIDDSSDLFELTVGDNLIQFNDDGGGEALTVRIGYCLTYAAVYED